MSRSFASCFLWCLDYDVLVLDPPQHAAPPSPCLHSTTTHHIHTPSSLQPSTKTRLRYYKRYVSPQVQQQGVRLTGAFRGTDRDEDVQHLVSLAQRYCGPPHHTPTRTAADSSSNGLQEGSVPLMTAGQKQEGGRGVVSGGGALSEASLLAYQVLDQEGIGLFASGLSHNQFRQLQQV